MPWSARWIASSRTEPYGRAELVTELLRGVISVVSRAVSSTTGGSIVGDSSSGGGSWSEGRGREIGGTLTRRGVVATCHGYADTTCSSSASWKPSRIVSSMAAQ